MTCDLRFLVTRRMILKRANYEIRKVLLGKMTLKVYIWEALSIVNEFVKKKVDLSQYDVVRGRTRRKLVGM